VSSSALIRVGGNPPSSALIRVSGNPSYSVKIRVSGNPPSSVKIRVSGNPSSSVKIRVTRNCIASRGLMRDVSSSIDLTDSGQSHSTIRDSFFKYHQKGAACSILK
jgi:hypothetical protein